MYICISYVFYIHNIYIYIFIFILIFICLYIICIFVCMYVYHTYMYMELVAHSLICTLLLKCSY